MDTPMSDCALCPRSCHVDRTKGQRGFCGQGAEITAARASLHFWEEPCISGQTGSGTVFFCGCSLGCVYCQNAAISSGSGEGSVARTLTPAALSEVFLRLQEQRAANINLVTSTHFTPQIAEAIRIARTHGLSIPVVWNTGGYEKAETLRLLEGLVDIYLTDAKYASPEIAESCSRARDYFRVFQEALDEMVRQTGKPVFAASDGKILDAEGYNALMEGETGDDYAGPLMKRGTIVRHLLLPGALEDTKRIIDYLLPKYRDSVYLSLMQQYTPMPQVMALPAGERDRKRTPDTAGERLQLNRRISPEEYEEAVGYALSRGLENGFFQGEGADDESFIPAFDGRGLDTF